MLRGVDKSGASGGEILFYFNWHRRGLAAREIVSPNITGLFKDDRILSERRKLDIEILEGSELFRLLAGQVGRKQVHATVAIGSVVDAIVRAPHRANVLRGIVR